MKYKDLKVGLHIKQSENKWIIEKVDQCTTHLSIVTNTHEEGYTKDNTGYYPFGTDFILESDCFIINKKSEQHSHTTSFRVIYNKVIQLLHSIFN